MKRHLLAAVILLTVPSLALAHVSVRPRESKAGAEERYTVRVPTEGAVATTHVVLEIPAGLTVLEVEPHGGADERVRAKAIHGLGREGDEPSPSKQGGGPVDVGRGRMLRVDADDVGHVPTS